MAVADEVGAWAAALASSAGDRSPADVLAGVAAALGVPWDGPGSAVAVPELPGAPGWFVLDSAREALLAVGERRRLGAHHTPPALARRLVALALEGARADPVVCDPACGGGAFLVAAADRLVDDGGDAATIVRERLVGIDVDPLAVATTRAALRCWARAHDVDAEAGRVTEGDAFDVDWTGDVVVGNPPFLTPLATATSGGVRAAARRRALGAPYVDSSALFLLRSLDGVGPGGRVVLIQPESLLSARDARPVRAALAEHLAGLWVAGEPVFGAAVRVCAPVLQRAEKRAGAGHRVARWTGAAVRRVGSTPFDRAASTWSHLRPTTVPQVRRPTGGGTVGDLATATAGFRDEFYGLAAAVTEGGVGRPLVTSGLIDPGRVAWGERSARIAGHRYAAPTVAVDRIEGRVRAWAEARLVPKVLVATQTRILEAAPDPEGRLVPMTPVLSVVPRDPDDVWRLAAALTSPLVSAWALRAFAGTALSADALKLSAAQVLGAPLPDDDGAWDTASERLRAGDVVGCGTALAGGDGRLLAWWRARLPVAARTV